MYVDKMLNLMKAAFEETAYSDKVTFLTSVKYLQFFRTNSTTAILEQINDLISSTNTRLQGLQFLEIALQQNSDIYVKGRWATILIDIIKQPVSSVLKQHACKILCMLIPYMAKDHVAYAADLQKFAIDLFPLLLQQVESRVEWIESAVTCLSICLRYFPQALESQKENLFNVIMQEVSCSTTSRTFEILAECYCFIPSCMHHIDAETYSDNWKLQYVKTLNTMEYMLTEFKNCLKDEVTADPPAEVYLFDDMFTKKNEKPKEAFIYYMRRVRRFINLCKCVAKMLSTKSKFAVQIPVKKTLTTLTPLFQIDGIEKISASTIEKQVILTSLSQMQVASLVVLESLISDYNIVPYSCIIAETMALALEACNMPNISSESISPLRHAVWKILGKWVGIHGAMVSSDIVCEQSLIIDELLKDISIENSSQTSTVAAPAKSKKNMALNSGRKTSVNKDQQVVCKEALKTLENVLYSGSSFISKKLLQEIFTKVVQLSYAIIPQDDYPFPYDDDICRKLLYSVLLAIAVVTKADQREPIQCANGILKNALQDRSSEVVRQCHKAMALCKLYLHPKKPIPKFKEFEDKKRNIDNESMVKFADWTTEAYVQNLPPVENVSNPSENITPRITQAFHNPNDGEMPSEEYMQLDPNYSDQAAESLQNGEDVLDIQNSSQCQDDMDSDEEDEDDDDERSYGDEEMNQEVELQAEQIYIPSTSKMQVMTPVHITPETEQNVRETEYEEWRPCEKSDDSNKNMHLNGVRSGIVPEEEVPSASTQNAASENGMYFEEEDMEEEEGEEDEEEEGVAYPAEKKVPDYFESPAKKQKLDNEVKEEPPDEREGTRSPTLLEMKADFCCNEIDDVKS